VAQDAGQDLRGLAGVGGRGEEEVVP
jgi:hypothetical protein